MPASRFEMEKHLSEILDGIERAPMMYGHAEAVELQYLLLLELLASSRQPARDRQQPRRVMDAWSHFIRRHYPEAGERPLSAVLVDPEAGSELAKRLAEFRAEMILDLEPDSPFATYDVALALRMKKARSIPSAERVGAYYGLISRVLRSINRAGGVRGRLKSELEEAIAIVPVTGFELVPENGSGAQVIIPFKWPLTRQLSTSLEISASTTARERLVQFVNFAAWTCDSDASLHDLRQILPDRETRVRMASVAMRLLPSESGDVDSIEIGGVAIDRQYPVKLRASSRSPVFEVFHESRRGEEFNMRGTLRMADLDDGRFRLRLENRKSIEILLPDTDAILGASVLLGRDVQVAGTLYQFPAGSPFVVANKITTHETLSDADESGGESERVF